VASRLSDDVPITIWALIVCAVLICISLWTHRELSGSWRSFLILVIVIAFSIVCFRVNSNSVKKELERHTGPLVAANEQTPLNHCAMSANSFLIFLDDGAVSSASKFPHDVFRFDNRAVLSIDKNKGDNLLLNFQVFDDRGDIIARMPQSKSDANSYWVRPDSRMERKDPSTLSVFNHKDQLVLDVHYLNFSAVKIAGTFRAPANPSRQVIISGNSMRTPAGTFVTTEGKSICFTDSGMDFYF
jgi:hypothetical protein